jgi:5-methyltetrahydrofolate--homocysteine methyltransferase
VRSRGADPAASAAPAVPEPPFLGARAIDAVRLESVLPYLNERILFEFHWGHRRRGSAAEHRRFLEREVRPAYFELARRCEREGVLRPRACYGYWRARREGDELVLSDPDADVARLAFPRQPDRERRCVTDFFAPADPDRAPDVVALFAVTLGPAVSDAVRRAFTEGRERESAELQGLASEAVLALAEALHRQIRGELGIAGDDARDMEELLRQGYRGARFAFGEPACPESNLRAALELLDARAIGVELDARGRLVPAATSAALVCHDPAARHFTP